MFTGKLVSIPKGPDKDQLCSQKDEEFDCKDYILPEGQSYRELWKCNSVLL